MVGRIERSYQSRDSRATLGRRPAQSPPSSVARKGKRVEAWQVTLVPRASSASLTSAIDGCFDGLPAPRARGSPLSALRRPNPQSSNGCANPGLGSHPPPNPKPWLTLTLTDVFKEITTAGRSEAGGLIDSPGIVGSQASEEVLEGVVEDVLFRSDDGRFAVIRLASDAEQQSSPPRTPPSGTSARSPPARMSGSSDVGASTRSMERDSGWSRSRRPSPRPSKG